MSLTVSDHGLALPDRVVELFHSQRFQVFPSALTTPQFHSPLKVLIPVQTRA